MSLGSKIKHAGKCEWGTVWPTEMCENEWEVSLSHAWFVVTCKWSFVACSRLTWFPTLGHSTGAVGEKRKQNVDATSKASLVRICKAHAYLR